jgi:hypothetical protein
MYIRLQGVRTVIPVRSTVLKPRVSQKLLGWAYSMKLFIAADPRGLVILFVSRRGVTTYTLRLFLDPNGKMNLTKLGINSD